MFEPILQRIIRTITDGFKLSNKLPYPVKGRILLGTRFWSIFGMMMNGGKLTYLKQKTTEHVLFNNTSQVHCVGSTSDTKSYPRPYNVRTSVKVYEDTSIPVSRSSVDDEQTLEKVGIATSIGVKQLLEKDQRATPCLSDIPAWSDNEDCLEEENLTCNDFSSDSESEFPFIPFSVSVSVKHSPNTCDNSPIISEKSDESFSKEEALSNNFDKVQERLPCTEEKKTPSGDLKDPLPDNETKKRIISTPLHSKTFVFELPKPEDEYYVNKSLIRSCSARNLPNVPKIIPKFRPMSAMTQTRDRRTVSPSVFNFNTELLNERSLALKNNQTNQASNYMLYLERKRERQYSDQRQSNEKTSQLRKERDLPKQSDPVDAISYYKKSSTIKKPLPSKKTPISIETKEPLTGKKTPTLKPNKAPLPCKNPPGYSAKSKKEAKPTTSYAYRVSRPTSAACSTERMMSPFESNQNKDGAISTEPNRCDIPRIKSPMSSNKNIQQKKRKGRSFTKRKPPPTMVSKTRELTEKDSQTEKTKKPVSIKKSALDAYFAERKSVSDLKSEECSRIFSKLADNHIHVSLDTLKRALLKPHERDNYKFGILSRK